VRRKVLDNTFNPAAQPKMSAAVIVSVPGELCEIRSLARIA
jgi:hypothetical protein